MIKVSIIIPIFNAGDRLIKCLDTIVNQTLHELEIICVLDRPCDGSERIVKEFASNDNRFKLIFNKRNLHVAESRNLAIELATGEYIGFSDHDDTRHTEMYEVLYNNARETDADIVFSNSYVIENGETVKHSYDMPTKDGVIRSIILPMHHHDNHNFLSKSIWGSIYRREFLIKNNISFKDRRQYYEEDTLFNLKAFLTAENAFHCNSTFYCWYKGENTESNSIISHDENVDRQLSFLSEMSDYLNESQFMSSYKYELGVLVSYLLNTYYPVYKSLPDDKTIILKRVMKECSFPVFGYYNGLKLISIKRLKLIFFLIHLFLK